MKQIYHRVLLTTLSLLINGCFLIVTNKRFFFAGLIASHGEVAYNLATLNSIQINPLRLSLVEKQQNVTKELIDYASLSVEQRECKPTQPRSINDTLGYGILLGILWKITQRYVYQDVQLLQIVLYCLCIILFYQSCLLIFSTTLLALLCSLCLILFLPLIFLNVHPLRDVWAFYGLILLVYAMINAYTRQRCIPWLLLSASLFSVCQWIRPTIFLTLLFFYVVFLFYSHRALKRTLSYFMLANLLLFWLPFCAYNSYAYHQPFVSCMGQDLYEGLGEFSNCWNIVMDDEWCKDTLLKKYNLTFGRPAFQAQAFSLFMQAVTHNPAQYLWQIVRRIPSLLIFCATMVHDQQEFDWAYKHYSSKVMLYATKIMDILTLLQRFCYYGRLYLLIGWIGIILLIAQGNYFLAFLIVGCALSGASKIVSHLEPRYLIPHYAFFAYAIGNLIASLGNFLLKKARIA